MERKNWHRKKKYKKTSKSQNKKNFLNKDLEINQMVDVAIDKLFEEKEDVIVPIEHVDAIQLNHAKSHLIESEISNDFLEDIDLIKYTEEGSDDVIMKKNELEKKEPKKKINNKQEKTKKKIVKETKKIAPKKEKFVDNSYPTKKNKHTNNYIGYNERFLIRVIGTILFFLLSIFLFVSSISIKAKSNVTYRQNSNVDYKVFLKPNDYYNENYLNKNMQYIASLIDNIDVSFNYNFNVNQNINYRYTYYIKADVSVTDSTDKTKVIYSKTDRLTEPSVVTMNSSNGFNIHQNTKIDYSKYNDMVKSFKSSYAISANSNLTLSLCVQIEDEKGNIIRNFESPDTMKLVIPLTEQMIDISIDYKEVNNSNNASIYREFGISNKTTLILSIISIITSVIFLISLIIFIKKTSPKKTIYDTTLARILRDYDRVIVNSKKSVNVDGDIIDVKSFNELIDVRDNLEKPIIFSEVHKGLKSVFIVKNANENYRYTLKLADLEREDTKNKQG